MSSPSTDPRTSVSWRLWVVLTLNAATGVVEVIAFAHLGGVFAAFVTGTIVLAGLHLTLGDAAGLLPYAFSFGGLIAGSLIGGFVVHGGTSRVRSDTMRGLATEALAIALAIPAHAVIPGGFGSLTALALLAAAMGVQFSVTKNLAVADVGFAAATGLIHGLIHGFARGHVARLPRKLIAIATLIAGAVAGALLARWSIPVAMLLALVLVLATLVVAVSATHENA